MNRQGMLLLAGVALAASALAQSPLVEGPNHSIVKSGQVEYLFPEQVNVPAGKASQVELHFKIAQGFHINSHTPHDDYLIPTVFSVPAASGVALKDADYPAGTDITLPVDPKTKLNVYTGEFAIKARIVAPRGNHMVEASLHYQACNQDACMPPKTITVPIDVIGK